MIASDQIADAVVGLPGSWRLDKPEHSHRKLRASYSGHGFRMQVFGATAGELIRKAERVDVAAIQSAVVGAEGNG